MLLGDRVSAEPSPAAAAAAAAESTMQLTASGMSSSRSRLEQREIGLPGNEAAPTRADSRRPPEIRSREELLEAADCTAREAIRLPLGVMVGAPSPSVCLLASQPSLPVRRGSRHGFLSRACASPRRAASWTA